MPLSSLFNADHGRRGNGLGAAGLLVLTACLGSLAASARADPADSSAADRQERRLAAREGHLHLPLPGTPDTEKPLTRLAAAGVSLGAPVMIRIFKAESQLEVWVQKDAAFVRFATYPVCYWSGALGPKLREGDRQSPEGFYTIAEDQLHYGGRWRRSLNIGYPNVFDVANGRDGSAILIHGGCDSIGCYAMGEAIKLELYDLVSSALRAGQRHVPVEVFPFRMTEANVAAHPNPLWREFWDDLKQGYDAFERTHLPPRVTVCGKRYHVADATPDASRSGEPIALCAPDAAVAQAEADAAAAAAAAAAVLTPAAVSATSSLPQAVSKAKLQRGSAVRRSCSIARPSCRRWTWLNHRRLAGLGPVRPAVVAHAKKPRKLR